MKKEISIKEWVQKFEDGEFNSNDVQTQINAGWYDWFCKDSSLVSKTRTLGKKLKMIMNSPKLDINNQYVFFKNNCPIFGSLHDDFRICDISTGDVVYTIVPRSGHKNAQGKGEVWGKENSFDSPLIVGTWTEIKNWFNS